MCVCLNNVLERMRVQIETPQILYTKDKNAGSHDNVLDKIAGSN